MELADDATLVLDAVYRAGNDIPAVRTVLDAAAEVTAERGLDIASAPNRFELGSPRHCALASRADPSRTG